jgi:hypothetical protein
MNSGLLTVAIILAYGPLGVAIALYLVGLGLRLIGRPGLLQRLIERTEVPSPVPREEADATPESA